MLRLAAISVCGFLFFAFIPAAQAYTWESFHPEVASAFSDSYVWWSYQDINPSADLECKQNHIVKGVGDILYTESRDGRVYNSTDLGYTWSTLGASPSFNPPRPAGYGNLGGGSTGLGVTNNNTLLMSWSRSYNLGGPPITYTDETLERYFWITRSTDMGQTWTPTALFDPSPYQIIADAMRATSLSSGRIIIPVRVQAQSRPGAPVSLSDNIFRSFVYSSDDDGATWGKLSAFPDHTPESEIMELPSGKLIASVRYQRKKLPGDPDGLAAPSILYDPSLGDDTAIGQTVLQNTAITTSEDGGLTWSTPRLVTGTLATTGNLAQLSDGTLILSFGRWGQRFLVSYDEGETWSNKVFKLNGTGEYSSTVALSDDTLVTVHDSVPDSPRHLSVMRWTAPSRSLVEQYGFFTPRDVETGSFGSYDSIEPVEQPTFPPGALYEDFEAPDVVGSPPSPTSGPAPYWEDVRVGGLYATPKIHAADDRNLTQYYDVDPVADGVSKGASQYWHFTTPDDPFIEGTLEFDIKGSDVFDGTPLHLRLRDVPSGGYDEVGLTFDLGQIRILDQSGSNDILVGQWLEDTWHHIWMSVDTETQTIAVSVNGSVEVSTTYTPGLADLDIATAYFTRHGIGASGFSLDNIQINLGLDVLLGDANLDGLVSADDFASVQSHFGDSGVAGGYLFGDANHDGLVSADDFASVQANFGNHLPEPTSLVAMVVGGVIILLKRRRELGG